MDITISRQHVCMGDDVDDHTLTYTIDASTKFSELFLELIKQKYFPNVSGGDGVWTLFCGQDDLMTWKIKENQLYSRVVDEEPTILSGKRWTTAVVNFKYCPSGLERARQIFTQFDGLKFHIWHEGFMPEYESYHISQAMENEWRKTLAK